MITTNKGVYAYMQKPNGASSVNRLPILIRNIYDLIPYTNNPIKNLGIETFTVRDTYIIAAGRRGDVPSRPDVDNLMRDMALVWDSKIKKYFLIGCVFQKYCFKYSEIRLVNSDMKDQFSNRTLKWEKILVIIRSNLMPLVKIR